MQIACRVGNLDIVKLLIEAGADVHSKGPNNLQPIHFACDYFREALRRLILNKKPPSVDATGGFFI